MILCETHIHVNFNVPATPAPSIDYVAEAVRALRAMPAYRNVISSDLPRLLHPGNLRDEVDFDDELRVMAGVRSYFQVAYKVRWQRV